MSEMIAELSEETFDEKVGASEGTLLVDFWAEWCGPCKAIAPILEEIAGEHSDSVKIAKLNVDNAPEIARRFNVMSIPTLIIFENGEETDRRIIGAVGKSDILEKLELA